MCLPGVLLTLLKQSQVRFPQFLYSGLRLFLPAELNFNFVLYLFPVYLFGRRDLLARLTDPPPAAKPIYVARAAAMFLPPSLASLRLRNPPPIFNFTISRVEAAKCAPRKVCPRGTETSRATPQEREERSRSWESCEKGRQVFRRVFSVQDTTRRSKNFVIQPILLVGILAKILNDP